MFVLEQSQHPKKFFNKSINVQGKDILQVNKIRGYYDYMQYTFVLGH